MKRKTKLIALLFIPALLLSACDEGGFSSTKINGYEGGQDLIDDSDDEKPTIIGGGSSGSQGGGGQNDGEYEDGDPNTNMIPGGQEHEVETVDLGSQILNFKMFFVKANEENFVNLSFENDPFLEKYNFSYYTVNDMKLDNCEYKVEENIDGSNTYKLFLGTLSTGIYVLKFFNKDAQQYGRADVSIKIKEKTMYKSYFSVSFNLVQIRFLSFAYSIENHFKQFSKFLDEMFVSDYIEM